MFAKILIANRGEIARRIVRTCRRMGIASVAVYSDADRFTLGVIEADAAVRLGPAPAAESYLNVEAVVAACKATGAQAVHPGYGFLSENVAFAERLAAEGLVFIGPRPEHLRAFGLKHTARELARRSGVPLLPGTGLLPDLAAALSAAEDIGYPVMLKSTAGGGGIGMRLCTCADELAAHYAGVERTARASFGDARVYLERFVGEARHVEVQIFGDGAGRVMALGERDCSLQRRNQKVIEETPAPGLSEATRARLHAAAVALGASVSYASAGTVEFIYDPAREEFSFLEVNTRLQVEHPVTEAVFGIDLVEWMIRQAAGEDVIGQATGASGPLMPKGAAMEARLYAESPHADFAPSAGLITEVRFPADARIDGWIEAGVEVTTHYDPMLAKIVVTGADRPAALAALRRALDESAVSGIATNLDYLRAIAASDLFASGRVATTALRDFAHQPRCVAVLAPGAQSSLQELPGRLGLWHVGVPPSGPMDARAFRDANALVGNAPETCALELTVSGPALRFHADATAALAGAAMTARLDEAEQPHGRAFPVAAGQTLTIGPIIGPGQRAYLAVRGGFAAPVVLGSRATFALGGFGGHATGVLKAGDVLHLGDAPAVPATVPAPAPLTQDWRIGVLYGPHGAPDFFQEADIADLFASAYEVHFNSARTGVRLVGPTPRWARKDGGEAGLHPSNLHDNAYAVGAIDFTGDMPILLGPDGPSLGGFVCPAVIARDEQWKMGQLRPGDTVRFHPVARPEDSAPRPHRPEPAAPAAAVPDTPRPAQAGGRRAPGIAAARAGSPILAADAAGPVPVVYRRQGDDNLLVEYGPMALDIGVRLRVHLLAQAVAAARLPGLIDLTPGIRSLQIHYDGTALPRPRLLGLLREIEAGLPSAEAVTVPSRVVHLPLSWNDPQAERAMRKYQELVRPDAPWCPSNIEFIRRINGLDSEEDVKRIVFDASYLVMGLGDVYLGAPVATPVDPRHRLVTTKYNPARTWTPENAVGIGGAYMCIYGLEGPGGYQLVGRTIQIWNTWRTTAAFAPGHPWLLRPFDRIRFFPVDHAALTEARAAFPHGAYPVRIEDGRFSYAAHRAELAANASEIVAAKLRQQTAFEAERRRWKDQGLDSFVADAGAPQGTEDAIPAGCLGVPTTVPGNVWTVVVAAGDQVAAGQTLAILESMKMEIAVAAPVAGRVREVRVKPGRTLRGGDIVAVIEEA
ncbi:urea carboxylase [uncultured Methylobacterium sp.]|uniref:urea carboxylase n=1 Tax=uncultured Methylobacterium sp. TaxID=157278 RepID=UPI0035CA3876